MVHHKVVQNMTLEEMMMELLSGCFNFRFQGGGSVRGDGGSMVWLGRSKVNKTRLSSSMIILTADETETGETGYRCYRTTRRSLPWRRRWNHYPRPDGTMSWSAPDKSLPMTWFCSVCTSLLIFSHPQFVYVHVCLPKGIFLTLFLYPLSNLVPLSLHFAPVHDSSSIPITRSSLSNHKIFILIFFAFLFICSLSPEWVIRGIRKPDRFIMIAPLGWWAAHSLSWHSDLWPRHLAIDIFHDHRSILSKLEEHSLERLVSHSHRLRTAEFYRCSTISMDSMARCTRCTLCTRCTKVPKYSQRLKGSESPPRERRRVSPRPAPQKANWESFWSCAWKMIA